MTLSLVGPDEDVAFYARRSRDGAATLVLGCGNGRVALPLADRSRVLGVDPSSSMIHAAEERRAELPSEVAARVQLVCADLRSLRLSERFALVLAPQSALSLMGSLDDLGALLATVVHHLLPDGAFIFDVNHPRPADAPPTATDEPRAPPGAVEPRRPLFAPHLRERKRGRGLGAGIHRLRLRQFEPDELDTALREAGLVARERYGSFEGKAYDAEDALQIIVAGPDG